MTHQHLIEIPCTQVGDTVCLRQFDHTTHDGNHHLGGYLFFHDDTEQDWRCTGSVVTCDCQGQVAWTASGSLSGGDLTLNPSVLCVNHNFHGWVIEGKWHDS